MTGRVAFHSVTEHRLLPTFALSTFFFHPLFLFSVSFSFVTFIEIFSHPFSLIPLCILSPFCSFSFMTFYFTFLPPPPFLVFQPLFFFFGTLSQSLPPFPLLQSSYGCAEKSVVRLKQHLGIFSMGFYLHCVYVCVSLCMRAHYRVSCLFNVTDIFSIFHNDPYRAAVVKM